MKADRMLFGIVVIALFCPFVAQAQITRCATPDPPETVPTGSETFTPPPIPVIFHIIYWDNPDANVSESRLSAQLDVLNQAYSYEMGFSFYLAAITRTQKEQWWNIAPVTAATTEMADSLAIDPRHAFNVYITQFLRTGPCPDYCFYGWNYNYPWVNAGNPKEYGVVIDWRTLPGGSDADHHDGDVLVHESGHYVGLYHTFQSACSPSGDEVSDTPGESEPHFGCPEPPPNTCNDGVPDPPDPIHNYMNYTNDGCTNEFSFGQGVRARNKLALHKPSIGGTTIEFSSTYAVLSGRSLKIFPGVTLKFANGTSFIAYGTLTGTGTSSQPVIFDRSGSTGTWSGINFSSGSSGSVTYAMFRNATKAIRVTSADPTIQNCTIESFTEQGIYVVNGNAKIYANTINGWNGTSRVGTGIYVDNSGLGSSTLEIANNNVVRGCIVGIDVTAPIFKLEHNTVGTSGTYTAASSNAYGINFAGVGTVTNNKAYGDNVNSWGINLIPNSGDKSATYNLLDHHYIGLIDQGFQTGSIMLNSFTENQISFSNSDGYMNTNQNNFWDSPVTTYNIWSATLGDPDMTNNYLQSYTDYGDPKIFDYTATLRWYPPQDWPFEAGPTWQAFQSEDDRMPATTESAEPPSSFSLSSYPNPFNPSTQVRFELPEAAFVSIAVYDLLGRKVAMLVQEYKAAGRYTVIWHAVGSQLSSSIYVVRLEAGTRVMAHKLLLTK